MGIGSLAAGVICEEVARADLSISYINLLASLNAQILADRGARDVVSPWLKRLTAAPARPCSPSRSPSRAADRTPRTSGSGSSAATRATSSTARRRRFSAADQADAAVRSDARAVESGAQGVTALFVPMELPGITRSRFDCHGQRAIVRGSLFLENVRVPVPHRLGDENKGFVQVMQGFTAAAAAIAARRSSDCATCWASRWATAPPRS